MIQVIYKIHIYIYKMIQVLLYFNIESISTWKLPRFSSYPYYFYCLFFFLISTGFCCSRISFILNGFTALRISFDCWKSSYCSLVLCHIFRVVAMTILIILLIFLMLLTFVFSSNANIFDNVFRKLFLSLLTSISSSKSSCTDSAMPLEN